MAQNYRPYDPRQYPPYDPRQHSPYDPRQHDPRQYSPYQPAYHNQHPLVNPPPLSPSALQAQAAFAQSSQTRGRPLPSPRREMLPSYPQHQQYHPAYAIPVPPHRSSSVSRPLPTPTPSPRSPAKHHSLDLGLFPAPAMQQPTQLITRSETQVPLQQEPTPSQIRRRASPPRFTGGSGSWSEPPPLPKPEPAPAAPLVAKSPNAFKDLLSGPDSTLESGKFVPLWKRPLLTNGATAAASSGRPLPASPVARSEAPTTGLKRGGSLHVRAPASTSLKRSPSPSPEPSDESESSESDDEESPNSDGDSEGLESESEVSASSDAESSANAPPPTSPQYGVRDLPRPPSMDTRVSTLPQPPEIRRAAFEGRSAPGLIENRGGSRTLMYAAASLESSPNKETWPAGVPPLPRTPGIPRTEVGDLEDSPPVSAIRRGVSSATTSGSRFYGQPSSPLSNAPSSSSSAFPSQPTVAKPTHPTPSLPASPQPPSISFSGPSSPPPSSQVPSLSLSGPSSSLTPQIPSISLPDDDPPSTHVPVPRINLPDDTQGPTINIQDVDSKPAPQIFEVPGISFDGGQPSQPRSLPTRPPTASQRRGLACGECGGSITGRIVNAMGLRWHPECFRCTVCNELLEHVSSYERDGKAYCHLDYHEKFAPRCHSCKTAIVEERFISLDDPQLGGKRTYHEQHFFCAECGDPFLPPSLPTAKGELAFSGDGPFVSDDVGFTVYRGHPYCEVCHVRLRLPKCKKCKRSIRDHDEAVEALGGKWCWGCFCCTGCEKPFEDPSFFEREGKPWCEACFSVLLRNEI